MGTTILQIRDMPESVVETLRARVAGEGMSLSAFVRKLLAEEAERPTMEEVLALTTPRTLRWREALGAGLLTLDAKFAGATGHRAQVQDYPYDGPGGS